MAHVRGVDLWAKVKLQLGGWLNATVAGGAAVKNSIGDKQVLNRKHIIVSLGDTLEGIAEKNFHDPGLGWLLADLNRHQVKESWMDGKRLIELKRGQLLELPLWREVLEFYFRRPRASNPANLVTIVAETRADRQLMDSVLGKLIHPDAGRDLKSVCVCQILVRNL